MMLVWMPDEPVKTSSPKWVKNVAALTYNGAKKVSIQTAVTCKL